MMAHEDNTAPAIVWFRDDLRLSDNPALAAAVATKRPLICVYIFDDASHGLRQLGGAARWFLHGALAALDEALQAKGGELILLRGAALDALADCAAAIEPGAVFWNRRYDGAGRKIDAAIEKALQHRGCDVASFDGNLLYRPQVFASKAGGFQVFSAFWRHALATDEPSAPFTVPRRLSFVSIPKALRQKAVTLKELTLLPTKPDWAGGLRETWDASEEGAKAALKRFLAKGLEHYEKRDQPALFATSFLSPHLRFGTVSPRQAWHAVSEADGISKQIKTKFRSELGWREFSHHLLMRHPDMATHNLRDGRHVAWHNDRHGLKAWQRGLTGYPIVDAGMRELWQTGWMHNRVRMITASFLIKHLLVDWRKGEEWFWDTLVDADFANNPQNWQWVAGTGADASPFFRVFNPILQSQKFDTAGAYIRRYVPELAKLPNDLIHQPWTANEMELGLAGITLGETYPRPIVEHEAARGRALAAWKARD
ncbi:MAG TPA: deoxyribodipyrimidine photo-lyase [Methylovirgula sp.]|nr:deoxyribodipyrimidine photo-lyase [Methylovirgula sp.]